MVPVPKLKFQTIISDIYRIIMPQKYVEHSPPPKIQDYVIVVPKKFQYQKFTVTFKILFATSLPMHIVRKSWNFGRNGANRKPIDLFTDSDAILNFCPVDFCLKWTLYFVSTSKIMIGNQFSINFDFQKLSKICVKVYIFMKTLTMKKFSYTLWRVRILQHWTNL